MAGFKLTAFGGFVPRVSPTLLADNEAQRAVNTKLYSGALTPWRKPQSLSPKVAVDPNTRTIHKIDSNGTPVWFAWTSDVHVAKGPLIDTQPYRMYYTGDGYPKKTNYALGGTTSGGNPTSFLSMGVPAPKAAPTATRVGTGTTSAEVRVYVITHISQFGDIFEESAPSLASSEVTVYSGDSVTVGNLTQSGTYSRTGTLVTITESDHGLITGDVVSLDFTTGTAADGVYTVTVLSSSTYTVTTTASGSTSGNVTILYKAPAGKYNIVKRRIYRSLSGTNSTTFQFVAEVDVTAATYSDTKTSAQLGEVLPSLEWETPPTGLKGLVEMPNGILAGFVGREVYFCEPYYPHAWPSKYAISVEYDVVGLGVFGQSLAVITKGNPYLISGVTSSSMSSEKIAIVEPCVALRSIVSDSQGVTYASPNGLVELSAAGPQLITKNVMLKDEFSVYVPYASFSAGTQGRYYMFYEGSSDIVNRGALIFDRNLPNTPLTQSNLIATAAFVDKDTGLMYIVNESEIKLWEGDTTNSLPYEWLSKDFVINEPVNFGSMEVLADFNDITFGQELLAAIEKLKLENQALFSAGSDLYGEINDFMLNTYDLNGSRLKTLPVIPDDRYVEVTIYADGVEKQRVQATQRGVYRLVPGYKSDRYTFKITGNVPLRHVKIAETTQELKSL